MVQPAYRRHLRGVLATIDLASDPVTVWDALVGLGIPRLDFLLPHGTWDRPPPGIGQEATPGVHRPTPYADRLLPLFDRWFDAPAMPVSIRMFEDLLHLVLGGADSYEAFGLNPSTLAVIETDGSYEQVDTLKVVAQDAAATGLTILANPVDDLLAVSGIAARRLGLAGLASSCRTCALVTTCGGGYYPHRYRHGTGFLNPSVYCADLSALISHVEHRADQALADRHTTLAAVRAT